MIGNPTAGSFITPDIKSSATFDLTSQHVREGTSTPTKYKVLYDRSNIPQEALITFTFEQCFNYYNWAGAVRVPGALQYANKLGKFVSEYIGEERVGGGELSNVLFFL